MTEWIKCSNKLPGCETDVLVVDGDTIKIAFLEKPFIDSAELEWWGNSRRLYKVTHWMPLPELP